LSHLYKNGKGQDVFFFGAENGRFIWLPTWFRRPANRHNIPFEHQRRMMRLINSATSARGGAFTWGFHKCRPRISLVISCVHNFRTAFQDIHKAGGQVTGACQKSGRQGIGLTMREKTRWDRFWHRGSSLVCSFVQFYRRVLSISQARYSQP